MFLCLCFDGPQRMDEDRGPGGRGLDTDHPWSGPSSCPVASRSLASTEAGDAQPISGVCFEGVRASGKVQGCQRNESGASRGGPLCIGTPRIDSEGSTAGSSPVGWRQKLSNIPRTERHPQFAICFGIVGTRQSRCRTVEGFSEKGIRAISCSTIGKKFGFLFPIHRTCERTCVSRRRQDPRSPGRQAVGGISIGQGSARSCEDGGGRQVFPTIHRPSKFHSATSTRKFSASRFRLRSSRQRMQGTGIREGCQFLQPTSLPRMACQNQHRRCRGSVPSSQR